MEKALEKDPAGPFRTKVRVKGTGVSIDRPGVAAPRAPSGGPGSLMEALEKARHPASARPVTASTAKATDRPQDSRNRREAAESETPYSPKLSRAARTRVGRLAAAKLRQLQRLKEAAAGLESLARGEIEEATVEIVRRDGAHTARRPSDPDHKR